MTSGRSAVSAHVSRPPKGKSIAIHELFALASGDLHAVYLQDGTREVLGHIAGISAERGNPSGGPSLMLQGLKAPRRQRT